MNLLFGNFSQLPVLMEIDVIVHHGTIWILNFEIKSIAPLSFLCLSLYNYTKIHKEIPAI